MIAPFKKADKRGHYHTTRAVSDREIVEMARSLINRRFSKGRVLTSPDATREFLTLNLAELEHESFSCFFLDNQHRVLAFEPLFRGTIDGASVYPREVVKRALQLNAAALIFAHNHPSGIAEPSDADCVITRKLIDALRLIDIRVLDHFIVGGDEVLSFAERGLI